MHILNIMQCTNLGGMEQCSLRLMQAMQQRGHEFSVVSVTPLGDIADLLKNAGITASGVPYSGRFGWRSHRLLRKSMREHPAEAIMMTGPTLTGMFALGDLCLENRVLAVHFHHEGVRPGWQWRGLYRLADKKFKAITFPSDFIRREAVTIRPSIEHKAYTVRNPLELPPLPTAQERAAARSSLGLPLNAPVVCNAGWLITRKRFDVFLDTAARIRRERKDARFVIAGDGPEASNLKSQAAALGIADAVIWLGWQKDLRTFYNAADVLLFNTDGDAFPTTPIEAMSRGIPVVASAVCSGLKEMIRSENCGHLLEEHDAHKLSMLVTELLADSAQRDLIGSAAREQVGRLCSIDAVADSWEHLLAGTPQVATAGQKAFSTTR